MQINLKVAWHCEKCGADNEFNITRQHVEALGTLVHRCSECKRSIEVRIDFRQFELPYI